MPIGKVMSRDVGTLGVGIRLGIIPHSILGTTRGITLTGIITGTMILGITTTDGDGIGITRITIIIPTMEGITRGVHVIMELATQVP